MMRTTKLLFMIALATGCGGKKSTIDTDDFATGLAKLNDYSKQMCACTDLACAKRVDGEEDAWEKALKHGKKPDDAQLAQWNQAKTEYRTCRDNAGSAGAAPTTTGAATSRAIEIQTRVADQMCACADAACAAKVVAANNADMSSLKGYQPASTEEGNALMALSQRMADCAGKLRPQ